MTRRKPGTKPDPSGAGFFDAQTLLDEPVTTLDPDTLWHVRMVVAGISLVADDTRGLLTALGLLGEAS